MEEAILENNESVSDDEDIETISAVTVDNVNLIKEWEIKEMEEAKFNPIFIETGAFLPETDDQYDIL